MAMVNDAVSTEAVEVVVSRLRRDPAWENLVDQTILNLVRLAAEEEDEALADSLMHGAKVLASPDAVARLLVRSIRSLVLDLILEAAHGD